MTYQFDYDIAFSRNIGWLTETEQQILKRKRVAIAGLGGVGGSHLLALTRLGICHFNLAEFDVFECENSNRQVGANVRSYGQKKLATMIDMAKAINPALDIKIFPKGVNKYNVEEFLHDVDCYVDSLDFFALDIRQLIFSWCDKLAIAATTAAPIGMGTAYLNFLPGKMTFEQYFKVAGYHEHEQYLRFYLGLAPSAIQRAALMVPTSIDLANKKGPSTVSGCQLAAGVTTAQVIKIFLNRGDVISAPRSLHFDAYCNVFKITWRPGGNQNLFQRLAIFFARLKLKKQSPKVALGKMDKSKKINNSQRPIFIPKSQQAIETIAEQVLDIARWAPSGDNSQCWRFKLIDDKRFIIFATDTRHQVVYDLDGHSSHLAHGILLETIEIAASQFGYIVKITRDLRNDECLKFDVLLISDPTVQPNSLAPHIKTRTVQRRAMGSRALTADEKSLLEKSLPSGFSVKWYETIQQKRRFAWLNFMNAKTRLTMKEAFCVHQNIIDWRQQFSETKIPEQALGVDWLTARLMQWLFKSWDRVKFFNQYLAGTYAPRIQLDLIPGLRCSTHFVILSEKPVIDIAQYIAAGRAVQKFWLTTDTLELGFQPAQTPLIFARYLEQGIEFTDDKKVMKHAKKCHALLKQVLATTEHAVFMGRIGRSRSPKSRSTRLPLSKLMHEHD